MKSDLQREGKPLGKPKKLSQKYQIVLPPGARDLLKVAAGEELQFWEFHGSIIITKNKAGGENIG
jgi:bifunctional DNA-binding transcriptional regulator/antitoxin component of YhaV-PrlF toxin-antitoxin module